MSKKQYRNFKKNKRLQTQRNMWNKAMFKRLNTDSLPALLACLSKLMQGICKSRVKILKSDITFRLSVAATGGVLLKRCSRVFQKIHRKTPVSEILKREPKACNFIKKESLAQVFSCEFFPKFLRISFFTEHLQTTAFAFLTIKID